MYEPFYRLNKTPFLRDVPAESLFRSEDTEEINGRLHYAVEHKMFAVIVGDCGTGKTTTLRRFCDELKDTKYTALYVADARLTPRLFYKSLLEQLGYEPKHYCSEAKRQLHREVEILKGVEGVTAVAIVDEAHLLPKEMLEEIRFLLNFKMDSQSPMALILSGQTELWSKLKLQSFAAIRQRVDINCVIGQLDRAKTEAYIIAHLQYVGADHEIFTDKAIDDIYRFSVGIPRNINKICVESLTYGAQNRKNLIDDHIVKLVMEHERNAGKAL